MIYVLICTFLELKEGKLSFTCDCMFGDLLLQQQLKLNVFNQSSKISFENILSLFGAVSITQAVCLKERHTKLSVSCWEHQIITEHLLFLCFGRVPDCVHGRAHSSDVRFVSETNHSKWLLEHLLNSELHFIVNSLCYFWLMMLKCLIKNINVKQMWCIGKFSE